MNIVKEQIDDLNAILKIEVAKDDYLPNVNAAINKYRKTVNMKGFRQGMVPAGLVRKMYGNSILFEELNKLVTEKLNEHIREEKLEILGQPLPKADANLQLDINVPSDVTLEYELGLIPEFDLSPVGKSSVFTKYKVDFKGDQLEEEIDSLRLRYGNTTYPEGATVEEDDVLHMDVAELENGEPKEGGVSNTGSPIGLSIFKEEARKQFIGMKVGESVDVRLFDISERDRASIVKFVLDIKDGEPEGMGEEFRLTLTKIGRMEKSELNQEFFDKIYGPGTIADEAAFRERIAKELSEYFEQQAEIKLKNDITSYLLEEIKMEFPDAFLKRWIKATNDKPITDEEVESDYENFTKGLRWSLITNRIGGENDIKAEREEVEALSKAQLKKQLEMYNPGGNVMSDADIDSFNASMMAREDHVKKTYEAVMEQKLFDFIRQAVTIEEKEVTLDEFRNLK